MRRSLLVVMLAVPLAYGGVAAAAEGQPSVVYNIEGVNYPSLDEAFAAIKSANDREIAKMPPAEQRFSGRVLALLPSREALSQVTAASGAKPDLAQAQTLLLDSMGHADIDAMEHVRLFDQVTMRISDTPKTESGTGFDYVLSFQLLEDGKHLGWRLRKMSNPGVVAGFGVSANGGVADRVKAFLAALTRSTTNLNNVVSRPAAPGGGAGIAPPQGGRPVAGMTTGTVFFIDDQAHALTNAHVVKDCKNLKVALADGPHAANVVEVDGANDLALLAVPGRQGAHARFHAPPPPRQGEDVVVYGFPLAGALSTQGNLTTGIISALSGLKDDSRYLQITAPVQPGNSGGPMLDDSGHVMGVIVSRLSAQSLAEAPQNVNFAIKSQIAQAFLDTNGIGYDIGPRTGRLATADIGDIAKSFTAMALCDH